MSAGRSQRLFEGPPIEDGPESFRRHVARLGSIPADNGRDIIEMLDAAGLVGRGGGGFPVGKKWRGVAERPSGDAVIVANGAEGEPGSAKDRALMTARPHLVLDGAELAADALGASEIVVYVGSEHAGAIRAMRQAIAERSTAAGSASTRTPTRLVAAPVGYVAGEATAAVHYINDADARPTNTPPRMSEAGVRGRPTLVQNVESLAHVALIARFGERWYRSAGRDGGVGTALVTIGGISGTRVREIELGTPFAEAVAASPGAEGIEAVVLGGYFGTWARPHDVWTLPLEPAAMGAAGMTFGCGMIGLLPSGACGVAATARIMSFMAAASAGQCGPCVHGLRSISDAVTRIASGRAGPADLADLERWAGLVGGRGACHHPDGAVGLMTSALDVFAWEFGWHARTGRCPMTVDREAVA